MKNLDEEMLKKVYPEPPESFHNAVISTLDSLEAEKPLKFTKRRKIVRIAATCAAVAVISSFAVVAAATDFFGLNATKKGTYGLNVTVDTDSTDENEIQLMNLKFGYLPDSYVNRYDNPRWFEYSNGDEYFNAWVQRTDNLNEDYLNVIDTVETEYDGHKTLFITFKEAENTDELYYTSFKYFDEYKCLIRCSSTNLEELKKITEKVDLEPAPADQPAPDYDVDSDNAYYYGGAIYDYDKYDEFKDELFEGRVKEVKVGESIKLSTADYDEKAVGVEAKVTSIKEQDNIDGLDISGFFSIGGGATTLTNIFNSDGTLIKEKTESQYEGNDEDHLGTAKNVTFTKHFYVAEIELTSDEDIDDLNRTFAADVFMYKDRIFYTVSTDDMESALKIYDTYAGKKLSLKKGETVTLKIGFITDNDVADMTYISLSAIDDSMSDYQNYMIKVTK